MSEANSRFDCSEMDPGCRALRHESRSLGVVDQDNLPFMLCPPGAESVVLLAHGFTATPWEMRPVAEFLAEAGIASLAVRLAGHGTSARDLAAQRWQDWQSSIETGFDLLSKDFEAIYGLGLSTGGLLLLAMARTRRFRGLTLFSPYLRISHRLGPYAGWLRWIRPYHEKPIARELRTRYYNQRPVAGIHQINRLIKTIRRQFSAITCPVLAFNGEGDQTVDINSGRELVDLLGSPLKIHQRYGPEVQHVLTSEENPCRQSIFAQTALFIQELDKAGPTLRVR